MRKISRLIRKKRFFFLDKRQRFALQTAILTTGMLVTQLIWEEYRFFAVVILSLLAYVLTLWSLTEDIEGAKWLLLFILPVSYTATVSLFYFLLPGRWITRLTITVIFAVGMYAILLVENIYNVSASRSIQLLRAARSVGLLLTLVVVFLSATIVYSLRLLYFQNMFILSTVTFILSLQSLWSINLEEQITRKILMFSFMISLGIGELAYALSFWPIENASYSLFLTASYYSGLSVVQQHLQERLFRNTIREYIFVFIFSFVLALLTTKWG